MKNRPKELTRKESSIYDRAVKIIQRHPVLSKQSSAMRRAWCEGFVNGHDFYKYQQPKKSWWEFWK